MKKGIRKFTAISLALMMGLSFTYTSYPVYAQDNIQTIGTSIEQTENSVAKVGDTYYDDLGEALHSAVGRAIPCELLKDATITGDYNFNYADTFFVLYLNDFTISGDANLNFYMNVNIIGQGTINANIFVENELRVGTPLTVNGNISSGYNGKLVAAGSSVFRVNGNISEFSKGYDFYNNTKVICTGKYPANSPIIRALDGNELIDKNGPLDLKGIAGQSLSTVFLPKDWLWVNRESVLSLDTKTYTARFNTTDYEMEYDFNGVPGYKPSKHYVEKELTVNVS